ncbi:hypothetical protein IZ6_25440 [Terrihabitans soli]|uniref:Phytanoyl-CoA dioxygenase family protein n=1 Tax=Terrihabitans soli TaxID=708113 RepID=A0A6S6QRX1_9HYPH|nr:hypothetical protein [Terrihabitans soli]BCJ91809.1 hypothetical protein IZ6_25440 [Terrihabitans soli]
MFTSTFCYRGQIDFPEFSGLRVMMMPVVLGDLGSIPDMLASYRGVLTKLFALGGHAGSVGYVTIDEKHLTPGDTTRRGGLHVDGVYQGKMGAWGGGGGWGSVGNGMLTVSSYPACRAWNQHFIGMPGDEGECDHLIDQLDPKAERVFGAGEVYWLDGLCVHESMPVPEETDRQFIRLSLPSNGPWFEGYTENPLGIRPSGEILPRREFM